jgi:hypothetical protein
MALEFLPSSVHGSQKLGVAMVNLYKKKMKDVKHSSLLSDTLQELDHMTETLDKLVSNREDNGKVLQRSETSMIQQISVTKSKLLKHIDELEQELITKLTSIKQKNETKIKKEKDEISCLASSLKDEKQELEFHKNHSSNNQLFVVLRKQISITW